MAHDPLNRTGILNYVDSPQYRWRRIGLPAASWALSLGNDNLIDPLYLALELLFVYLGAWWLARYAVLQGWPAAWGLAFLAIPATAVSLDRLTVDLPIAAIAIALLLFDEDTDRNWPVFVILSAAPLIRETGLLLIAAWCARRLLQQEFRNAMYAALCTLPSLAWFAYARLHSPPDATSIFGGYPFEGLITWTIHALQHPVAAYGPGASAALELLALAGIWLAFALTGGLILRKDRSLATLTALIFVLFASLIGYQDIWASAYALGRTLAPLLIALAAFTLRKRGILYSMPLLLIIPRIALQFAAEIRVGLRG